MFLSFFFFFFLARKIVTMINVCGFRVNCAISVILAVVNSIVANFRPMMSMKIYLNIFENI